MKRLQHVGTVATLWLLNTQTAWAAGAGTGLAWDAPMTAINDGLKGAPAHAIISIMIVLTGIAYARTNHSVGLNNLAGVAMGGSLALGVLDYMGAFGWGGACL